MIKKLKNFLKLLRENQELIKLSQGELWAEQKLNTIFEDGTYIPLTNWSMSPRGIVHILNIISIHSPKSIIEFGSGATTLYIAKLLQKENKKIPFYSIESDLDWNRTINNKIEVSGLSNYVTLIDAPIAEINKDYTFNEQISWYDTLKIMSVIKDVEHFDLVIVDGPFGGATPYARYSAQPFLKEKTNKNTIWFLDDTNREQETTIAENWSKETGLKITKYPRYSILLSGSKFDPSPYSLSK